MKRTVFSIAVLTLALGVLAGCPQTDQTPIATQAKTNAELMKEYLEIAKIPVVVKVKDVDGNGRPDLLITYLPQQEQWDEAIKIRVLTEIAASIWEINRAGQLDTDLIFLFVRDEVWRAAASNLIDCESSADDARQSCVLQAWTKGKRSDYPD